MKVSLDNKNITQKKAVIPDRITAFFLNSLDIRVFRLSQKKGPDQINDRGPQGRRRPTLPPGVAVPSALTGLTSLFGMVRGGPRRHGHLKSSMFLHGHWAMVCPNCSCRAGHLNLQYFNTSPLSGGCRAWPKHDIIKGQCAKCAHERKQKEPRGAGQEEKVLGPPLPGGPRAQAYGQLVPLGYGRCRPSTYGLSTWSSPTAL